MFRKQFAVKHSDGRVTHHMYSEGVAIKVFYIFRENGISLVTRNSSDVDWVAYSWYGLGLKR